VSFDEGVFDPQVFGAQFVESCLFDPAVFDAAVFDVCLDGEPEPEPEVLTPVVSGGVRRSFVHVDGRLRAVSGYQEAEKLLRSLKKEEKLQEQDQRKLKIHIKSVATAPITGRLYAKAQERVQVIEARMDDRLEKMAALAEAIERAMDQQDEEEILLLL
jgi:hypothetical protein